MASAIPDPASVTPDDLLLQVLVIAACIVTSAFFSFCETCLTSLSHGKIHAILATQGRRAGVLNLWLERPHQVLTTILVGNTVVNALASALLGKVADDLWGSDGVTYAVAIASFLILVFGEITPKTLARQVAMKAAVPAMHVLRVAHVLLWPVTWVMTHLSRWATQLMGIQVPTGDVTQEEIEAMIDLASREGVLTGGKGEYLSAVFRMSTRAAREVMVARTDIAALDLDLAPDELIRRVDESGHSRIPVYRESVDEIVGVLLAKDLLHALIEKDRAPTRDEIRALVREPLFVPESLRLDKLLRLLRRGGQHLAVVLDEFGGTSGIATLEDVLEELVGDIRDEHDAHDAPVLVRRGPGRWRADGRLPLKALEEDLGLEFGDIAFDTLGGLLMDLAGEVPKTGSAYEFGGFRFEVLDADAKRVGLVRLVRLDAPDAARAGV